LFPLVPRSLELSFLSGLAGQPASWPSRPAEAPSLDAPREGTDAPRHLLRAPAEDPPAELPAEGCPEWKLGRVS
ncbi:hypothetical protein KM043_000029, partial [Ampulex compressa]